MGVLHVDETPGRAGGGLEYVHVAATPFLTAMHTGGRSGAGAILPGYAGTMVRDGYAGYAHLIDAHHAWCGAHLLRDLRAVHTADSETQLWAAAMAATLTDANTAAAAARAAGQTTLDPQLLATIRNHYRGALALGISANSARAGPLAANALTLVRRFQTHEDMILRFVVDLAVPVERHSPCRRRVTDHGDELWITPGADFLIGVATVTVLRAACCACCPGIPVASRPAPQAPPGRRGAEAARQHSIHER
ncbi:MAG: IS66 family transposase [Actinomycetota bacterium]|nr:IS66 family transposase [Actinomycetota bacterium]